MFDDAVKVRDTLLGRLAANAAITAVLAENIGPGLPDDDVVVRVAKQMYRRARQRAKGKKIAFSLREEDVRALLRNSGWRCALTGIPLESARDFNRSNGPYKPSLDRIKCGEGYAMANCRIVCVAVNVALNVWGEEVLRRIAQAFGGYETGHAPEIAVKPENAISA